MRSLIIALSLVTMTSGCIDYGIIEKDSVDDTAIVDTGDTALIDLDGDGFTVEEGDCDDEDDRINPTRLEVCNGVDDNCDGNTDGDAMNASQLIFFDYDGDGYGDDSVSMLWCQGNQLPVGYVLVGGDCDDWHAEQNPGAPEYCNGADDDCDGVTPANEIDADGDGYNGCTVAADCDDTNPAVYPGAPEICDWIPDNNCDGDPDSGDLDGPYDANGDGDYDDPGDVWEYGGVPDGYTWCYTYFGQVDEDRDRYCDCGLDFNGDGDCTDEGIDLLYPQDVECPEGLHDCDVTDPTVYPGHGC